MENKEEYFDCFISSKTYHELMEIPAFLPVDIYPNKDFAIQDEIGKLGIGYRKYLRFFIKKN